MNTGCCGMAGSFGYEKEHYELSMQVGEDTLFPKIRNYGHDIEIIAFGEDAKGNISTLAKADSIPATGLYTNITKALKVLSDADESDAVQAAILFSDGAVNAGANPIYEAEVFGRPVFTVGIGDSVPITVTSSIITPNWNNVLYLSSEYKISITTSKGNFFTSIATPFNT